MATPTFDELLAKLTLQNANISTYALTIGATTAEIADISNDLANLEYAEDYADVVDGNKKTIFQIKQALFNGDEDVEIPKFPTFTDGVLPGDPPKAGSYQRFMERGKRWKTSPGWTPEIGTALGYDGPAPKPSPDSVKPEIKVFAAASGYHFSVVVSDRGEANMWDVYVQRKSGGWVKTDSATGKSADIHVTPSSPGDAEQIQVRVQLRKANADYGQVSDPAYVTINP